MQEEMNEKTVSLIIRGTKVTAVVLKDAMKMCGVSSLAEITREQIFIP